MKTVVKKILKIVAWIVCSVIALILLLFLLVNIPAVQNLIKNKAVSYLSHKLHTNVKLAHINIDFPSSVELDKFYIADQKGDTLLYSGRLYADISMMELVSGNVKINKLDLDHFSSYVYRTLPDTTYNFNFILQAFSSNSTKPKDTSSSSSSTFIIHDIRLSNIHVRYKDDVTGYDAEAYLGKFNTHFETFNLDSMRFDIDSVNLQSIFADVTQSAPLVQDTSSNSQTSASSPTPEISLKAVNFNRIYIHYNNTASGVAGIIDLGNFELIPQKLDLKNQSIDLKKLALNNTNIAFRKYQGTVPEVTDSSKTVADTSSSSSSNWVIKLGEVQLTKDYLKYDNALAPKAQKGIDYNHLSVQDLNMSLNNVIYSTDSTHAIINDIYFHEQSGLTIKKFTTEVTYTNKEAKLEKLDLETNNSQIKKYMEINYASLADIGKHPGNLGINADLTNCVLDLNDVLYFVPSLDKDTIMQKLMHSVIHLNGSVRGKLSDLKINGLDLATASQTHLAANAYLRGLPDMDKSSFNVQLKDFTTGRSDINRLLPASIIPSSVSVPRKLSLTGNYKGSLSSFDTRLLLKTTDGNVNLQATIKNLTDSVRAAYQATVKTDSLDLGKILKQDSLLGKFTLQTDIKGSGLTTKSADARLNGTVELAQLKGYNYKNLQLDGGFNNQQADIKMQMKDPNLNFNLTSSANLAGRYPAIKLKLQLDSANLYALHFAPDTTKFRGLVTADFPSADIDHLNGQLILSDLQMVKQDKRFNIDSISLSALSNDTIDRIHLDAPFAMADISGHYRLSQTGDLINGLIQHYFGEDSSTLALMDSVGKQDMQFKFALYNNPVLYQLAPSVKSFSGAFFNGEISSVPQRIEIKGDMPELTYGGLQIDSLHLNVGSDPDKLNYALVINAITNGSMQVHKTSLSGTADHNNLNINLHVQDAQNRDKYHLAGLLNVKHQTYRFNFKPDSLLLNYDKWQVPQDNYIVYQPEGIVANNLKIENQGQYLLINSPKKSPDAPLEVNFNDFKLETLTKIASKDTAFVSGNLNGKIVGDSILNAPVFTADLNIDSFKMRDQPVGNIALQVNNKVANDYAVNVAIKSDSNDFRISGDYFTKPESRFDFTIDIPSFQMASAQAFTFGQVKDDSGIFTGKLHLQGTTTQPHINGAITFKNAALNITQVNDYLKLPNETINFDDQGIHFNRFTILDSLNNKAYINGDILTSNFQHYNFNFNITARNFRALNAKKNENELFYGPVYINTNVRVRGDENLPKVDMDITLNKNSVFTVVLPQSNPAVESSEGVVKFIDASHIKDTIRLGLATSDTLQHAPLKGLQLSANISVDTAAVMNIVIDPTNGDNLRVKGDATLNMTMDQSGKISLTGRYQINDGTYSMSINGLIKRQFDIKSGSSITWTGDPTSANLDLTAVYNIKTSAMELVEDQLTDVSETTKNTYKQKLPFMVDLNINGELLKPDISFALDMPENSRNAFNGSVYTRINQINQQESEVNKQVLGLLVLGHFIGQNPFQSSSGGGGAEQVARESASKILSQQLNNLAGSLIKGVDINFDLQSSQDYSTGKAENQTNLNIGLSKSLFNGRTTVYVGSNVQLEGPQQANQKTSQIAGDVAIEYKLSRDGRYRLKAYRQNEYEGVIEGEYIETGLSFIIVMDYNHFKELFQSARKRNKQRRQNRENNR